MAPTKIYLTERNASILLAMNAPAFKPLYLLAPFTISRVSYTACAAFASKMLALPIVLVRACVQTVGLTDEEARAAAKNIRIETGSTIRAEGAGGETNWAVSYEILVPRSSNLKLSTHNGGIGISSVEGTVQFEAINGGVSLSDMAGDVKGTTKNGGVSVELSGGAWRGNGLDVKTTNGGVKLSMPENYAARVETGTVNGGFKSEISQLNVERNERNRAVRINTDLNGGGAPIRVVTTNGGVKIGYLLSKTL